MILRVICIWALLIVAICIWWIAMKRAERRQQEDSWDNE